MHKKSRKTRSNLLPLLLLSFLVLLGLGFGYYTLFVKQKDSNSNPTNEVNNINYNPPTDEEKQAGDQQKETIVNQENNQSELPNEANVVIVDASQYDSKIEVRAFVSNIIEDGTCIIKFTMDSYSLTKEVPAYADASTTPCIAASVDRSEFASVGQWNVVVTYKNSTIMGSAKGIIDIQ